MRHRFLIHSLSHTVLLVDISQIGLPTEIYPAAGRREPVPTIRFNSWKDAQQYLATMGADAELLEKTLAQVTKAGIATLTVV